jgi:hypothetical protein
MITILICITILGGGFYTAYKMYRAPLDSKNRENKNMKDVIPTSIDNYWKGFMKDGKIKTYSRIYLNFDPIPFHKSGGRHYCERGLFREHRNPIDNLTDGFYTFRKGYFREAPIIMYIERQGIEEIEKIGQSDRTIKEIIQMVLMDHFKENNLWIKQNYKDSKGDCVFDYNALSNLKIVSIETPKSFWHKWG